MQDFANASHSQGLFSQTCQTYWIVWCGIWSHFCEPKCNLLKIRKIINSTSNFSFSIGNFSDSLQMFLCQLHAVLIAHGHILCNGYGPISSSVCLVKQLTKGFKYSIIFMSSVCLLTFMLPSISNVFSNNRNHLSP